MATGVTLPKDAEGFEARIKIDDVDLVLRAGYSAVGFVSGVFDAKAQRWKEQKFAADIHEAKTDAEEAAKAIARHALTRAGSKKELPPTIDWQPTG